MPKTKTQDFQIPADTLNSQKIPLAEPNFINPTMTADVPVNQIANQGLESAKNMAQQNTPVNPPQNQAKVFGKSELLNANQILNQVLGLKIGHRVADLGAGGGLFTLQAARLVGGQGEVYAVDIMKTILSDIESKSRMANLYNIKTIWSNIEIFGATKIPEATLDFVLLVNILFQSKSIDKMLSEAARLMKNGGKMLVIDWNDNQAKVGPHNDRRLDPNNIIAQAEKINLKLDQQFMAGQYHFGLIFIKQ